MSDKIVTLAENQQKKLDERKALERKAKSERQKKLVPLIALIACNLIFLSLEVRSIQAVYLISASYLLAVLTAFVSGGLAMLWFDVLYPHSKKHQNEKQVPIAIIATGLAILLSAVLAFADYIVVSHGQVDPTWSGILWGFVVALTVVQGGLLARWWMLDKHIESEAKQESAIAEQVDSKDEIAVLKAKLVAMKEILTESASLKKDFGREAVVKVAKFLDIPLPDEDGDGIADAEDPIDNRTGKPFARSQERPQPTQRQMTVNSFAKDAERAELASPTDGPKQK